MAIVDLVPECDLKLDGIDDGNGLCEVPREQIGGYPERKDCSPGGRDQDFS